jgi:hypothetical protein
MTREEAIAIAQEMAKICRVQFCIIADIKDDNGFKYYYAPNQQFDRFVMRYIDRGFIKSGIVSKEGVFRNLTYEEYYKKNLLTKAKLTSKTTNNLQLSKR